LGSQVASPRAGASLVGPGLRAAFRRETVRILERRLYVVLLLVMPVGGFLLLWGLFARGVPRELPVALVDFDRSPLSRQLTRAIDALPSARVTTVTGDLGTARELVLEGRVYGYVVVPEHLERDVRRGAPQPVVAYTNTALLLPASLLRRDLRVAVGTLSAGIEVQAHRARGETEGQARESIEPVRTVAHTLYNPWLSYVPFLLAALYPTLVQLFALLAAVLAVGSEIRDGTAGAWLDSAGGSLVRALAGKLLPHVAVLSLVALFMNAVVFTWAGTPLRGSLGMLALGSVLLVLASLALGVLFVAWTANLRFATSVAAFCAGPAFAFAGVTFPTAGMPLPARIWSQLLPLTHFVRLLVDQGVRGVPPSRSLATLAALAAFAVLGTLAAWPRLGRIVRDPRYWGRE
jgi:ABC-2 type transport system permease protein